MTGDSLPACLRIHLIQGDCEVTRDPQVVMTTTLGSCVSACIRDPKARIGGMNHFLLPEGDGVKGSEAIRYGAYAMELLVNALLRLGGRRERLQATLFGGGRLGHGLIDIGAKNAAFAEQYLEREGISYLGGSLGGSHARRIQFWPVSGRVRQMKLSRAPEGLINTRSGRPASPAGHGNLELF